VKRILIFTGLKVGEFIAAVAAYFVCYLVGFYGLVIHVKATIGWGERWILGPFMGVAILVFVGVVAVGICHLIRHNWRMAGELAGREK